MSTSLVAGVINMDFVVFCVNWLFDEWLVEPLSFYSYIIRKLHELALWISENSLIVMCVLFILFSSYKRIICKNVLL